MKYLEKILEKIPDNVTGRLIITDGVFSMDGDIAKLDKITQLAQQYNCKVMATKQGYIKKTSKGGNHNIKDGDTFGFKYFDCKGITGITITSRGYGKGVFEVRTSIDGEVFAEVPCDFCTVWTDYTVDCKIPDGVNAIYFTFKGDGNPSIKSFKFLH